ncbi:MAG: hypothetical protein JXA30_02110 [Deltaproteobacteria bacterium]|nr:hypothetical protein [Deltaproteobacteria bacterium]
MDSGARSARASRNIKRKESIRELLSARDEIAIKRWARQDRNPFRPLASLLFDPSALMRWRAIEALGWVAPIEFAKDPERVRRFIRRILWLMNDESGGVCWNGPEAIAEVIHAIPPLIEEYARLLPSFFAEEPFELGSRWAVARVAQVEKQPFLSSVGLLFASLADPDAGIRAFSLVALKALGQTLSSEKTAELKADASLVSFYDFESGRLVTKSIGELV